MKNIHLSFTDFWQGHDPNNNIISNIIKDIFDCDITITDPENSDINLVTIYGRKHLEVIKKYRNKSILWLGENKRPNVYNPRFSISFDYSTYSGINHRLPLWYSEIDWYNSGLGVIKKDALNKLVIPGTWESRDLKDRQFCIAIFNNPEGMRMQLFSEINKKNKIDGYGKPFGNWFPTYETYQAKMKKLGGYLFNFCPENSLFPGYYTEKCFHAKVAETIPIYMADSHVISDFRPQSFLNAYDYKSTSTFSEEINNIFENLDYAAKILNEPLLYRLPSLDSTKRFLFYAINKIFMKDA